jgi:hypothetical protein
MGFTLLAIEPTKYIFQVLYGFKLAYEVAMGGGP